MTQEFDFNFKHVNNDIDFKIEHWIVVHIPTEELANKVDELLDNLGATRWHGGKYSEDSHWYFHKENTCYDVHLGDFCEMQWYTSRNYKIISAVDFLKLHGIKRLTNTNN